MGRIVGIDLGTTYCAVTIPEERSEDGFLTVRECPGYSVILDGFKRRITPSVVAENEKGEIVVGYTAKARAGFSPEPVMFAKRYMGTDTTFQLGKQGTLSPAEVSAHILRYLKKTAEERLKETVDEAVITVPAYFDIPAKQMTKEAGELAGLQVAQIAQEPVAAALMYCAGDTRDPLKVMTYDLGGGTFDVAILEKRDGTISTNSIRAFDGDRFLGGYDFDKILTRWILDQLIGKGYDLKLDSDHPADKVILAKLMILAEQTKIRLSNQDTYDLVEPASGIVDHSGNPVEINLTVTRTEFETMITKQVDYTIELCRRAMQEKANPPIRENELDEILMVGGSSRIPLVQQRLEMEFKRKPKLIEPDLCVALGAAILAGTKPKTFGRLKLDTIPAETDLPHFTLTGRVLPEEGAKEVQESEVRLRASDGSYDTRRSTGAEGGFVFDAVPLAPDEKTDFVLSVTSSGSEVEKHPFSITQKAEVKGGGLVEAVTNVLAKPIGILFEDGFHVIAPERTPLPYETIVNAETIDTSGFIKVSIREENNPLGEILMRDIPSTLPIGSGVEITLTFQENYQIRGRAYIPSLAKEEKVVIDIPVPPQKSLDELRSQYDRLTGQAKDALASAGAGVLFGSAKAKRLNDRLTDCKEMIDDPSPEPFKIQDCMNEIESLIRDISAGWRPEPPRAVFQQKANEASEHLAAAIKDNPKIAEDGYDRQLEAIRSEAEKAYAAQNTATWKDSFEKVVKLCDRLEDMVSRAKGGGAEPQADPAQILLSLARELATLEKWAKDNGRYNAFQKDFEELSEAIKRIDPNAPDAMTQIVDLYRTKFLDLQKRLQAPETEEGILKLVSTKGKK